MNNMCPTCGAIYNVAAKDVGRRIKCKKCEASLLVGPNGLEPDDGATVLPQRAAAAPHAPAAPATLPDDDFDAEPPRRRRDRDMGRRPRSSFSPAEVLARVGGVSTLIFGFGAFLVIVFLFLPIIGNAAV